MRAGYRSKQSAKPKQFKPKAGRLWNRSRSTGALGVIGYFRLAKQIWFYLLLSLPLDLLVINILSQYQLGAELSTLSLLPILLIICTIPTLLILNGKFADFFLALQKARSKERLIKLAGIILLVITLIGTAHLLLPTISHIIGAKQYYAALVLIVAFLIAVAKTVRDHGSFFPRGESGKTPLATDMQRAHQQLLVLISAPAFLGRAISILGVAAALLSGVGIQAYLPYFLASLLVLLASIPTEDQFLTTCTQCSLRISIAAKHYRYCPLCEREGARKISQKSSKQR